MTKIETLFKWNYLKNTRVTPGEIVTDNRLLLTQFTKFVVIVKNDVAFNKGTVVTLLRDDGSALPLFTDKGREQYLYLDEIEPVELYEMRTND